MKNDKSARKPAKGTKARSAGKSAGAKAKSSKRDPRKVAPPTASASVAAKAAEAVAPVAAVATAEPKSVASARPAALSKTALEAAKPVAPAQFPMAALGAAANPFAAAFNLGEQARAAFVRSGGGNENLRQAASKGAQTTTRGFIELNDKFLDLWRAQSDAALELWRSTLSASSVAEAVRVQTSGFRQSYEATTSGWKDIAETAGRLMGDAAKSFQSNLSPLR